MRICVPTEHEGGLDTTVYTHFGSAPFFCLLDTETAEVENLDNSDHDHQHGRCRPVQQLAGRQIDAVAVRGMGRNALSRFAAAGIPVYLTTGVTLKDVLQEARGGMLQLLDPEQACQGHGHGHHHAH